VRRALIAQHGEARVVFVSGRGAQGQAFGQVLPRAPVGQAPRQQERVDERVGIEPEPRKVRASAPWNVESSRRPTAAVRPYVSSGRRTA
jgi:hypothetical protein